MLLELMAPAKCFPAPVTGHSGSLLGSEGLLCVEPGGLWQDLLALGEMLGEPSGARWQPGSCGG